MQYRALFLQAPHPSTKLQNFSIDQITEQENAVEALIDSVTGVKPELQLQGNLPDNVVILLDGKEIT